MNREFRIAVGLVSGLARDVPFIYVCLWARESCSPHSLLRSLSGDVIVGGGIILFRRICGHESEHGDYRQLPIRLVTGEGASPGVGVNNFTGNENLSLHEKSTQNVYARNVSSEIFVPVIP